jgi:hypothetical protein
MKRVRQVNSREWTGIGLALVSGVMLSYEKAPG